MWRGKALVKIFFGASDKEKVSRDPNLLSIPNVSDILDLTTTKGPHTASAGKQTFVVKKLHFPHLALSTMCTFITQQDLRPKTQSSCQWQRRPCGLWETRNLNAVLKKKDKRSRTGKIKGVALGQVKNSIKSSVALSQLPTPAPSGKPWTRHLHLLYHHKAKNSPALISGKGKTHLLN